MILKLVYKAIQEGDLEFLRARCYSVDVSIEKIEIEGFVCSIGHVVKDAVLIAPPDVHTILKDASDAGRYGVIVVEYYYRPMHPPDRIVSVCGRLFRHRPVFKYLEYIDA